MNLTLVISNPAQLLHGCQPTHRFALHGGSIGSADCDWLLNDRSHSVRPTIARSTGWAIAPASPITAATPMPTAMPCPWAVAPPCS
ncbi:hypothetical protein [Pseudomonas helleri]|uniref:hypothetical protein n=1 Tax=Pseudomonas helleri TaxID=1608996 RepID=UPI001E62D0EE|nr:hypothetical protein [Pseudomonas helleri]